MFIKDIILEGKRIILLPYAAQYSEEYFQIFKNRKDIKSLTNAEPNISMEDFIKLSQ